MGNTLKLFNQGKWKELFLQCSPLTIAEELGFNESLTAAYYLLYNNDCDECMQEYAVTLIYVLKGMFPKEWAADWRYDAFLGDACDITLKYDDRYLAYRRAYEHAHPAPPRLLINLARCYDCPGRSPIAYEEAVELLKKVIENYPYIDALEQLKSLYFSAKDKSQEDYWSKVYKEVAREDKISPPINYSFIRGK